MSKVKESMKEIKTYKVSAKFAKEDWLPIAAYSEEEAIEAAIDFWKEDKGLINMISIQAVPLNMGD
jgi:hypothetical protein